MQLPDDFIQLIRPVFGEERFECFMKALDEESPVSIRVNPRIVHSSQCTNQSPDAQPNYELCTMNYELQSVPWCRHGFYLPTRPNFTFDPLLHAGCYYVQEAASMFLDQVLCASAPLISGGACLDLCAAPGGKSTLLRAALPEGSMLYSNEPVRQRASILAENMQKWGYPNCVVTNNYPRDYRKSKLRFDVILCDVPCSGEGMFRKDPATIGEWSPKQVEKCWQLQRDIVSDAWQCLRDGGLFIYSTCTFNTKENEENIRWLLSEYDAEALSIDVRPEWNITGSLLEGFNAPVYRFIPGITRSEGLFMCVIKKGGEPTLSKKKDFTSPVLKNILTPLAPEGAGSGLQVSLTYAQAIAYLRHEAITLPDDTPRGLVEVCFQGHPLGFVKNLGTRANNLYPKEWRIKTTHIPTDYEAILRHT